MKRRLRTIRLLAVAGFAACGGDPGGPVDHGSPVALVPVSGMDQSALVGQALPNPVVVRVVDASAHPVPGQIVNFVVTSGGGHVFAGAAITNASGLAQEIWTLGPVSTDSQRLEARAVDPESGDPLVFAHFSATALPLPPTSVALVSNSDIEGYPGMVTMLHPTVRVRNGLGVGIPGVSVHFAVTSGGGSLAASSVLTDSAGLAPAPDWTLGGSLGTNTLAATVDTFPALTATATGIQYIAVAGHGVAVCALTTTHKTRCWGQDWLGNGDSITHGSDRPTPISPDPGFVTLAGADDGGSEHICGLTAGGAAYCWGWNSHGQIGDGTTQPSDGRRSPTLVTGGLTFASIDVGESSTCGVTTTGAGYCWGANGSRQLGISGTDSLTDRSAPALVSGGHTWSRIAIGREHACGITTTGEAYCWGNPLGGRMGYGSDAGPDSLSAFLPPKAVVGGHSFTSIMTYVSVSCGLADSVATFCWGHEPLGAGVGDGTLETRDTAVAVTGGLTFASLAPENLCGRTAANIAYCWGGNSSGQVGDSSLAPRLGPVPVAGGHGFVSLWSGGSSAVCGIDTVGRAWCWGLQQDSGEFPQVVDHPVLIRP